MVRASESNDKAAIEAMLQAAELPLNGLDHSRSWVVEVEGKIAGHVAMEETDDAVVLRSLVVAPEFQGKGIARLLMEQAEAAAGDLAIALRTKTVGPWMERRGYLPVGAELLPKSLLATSEFSGSTCSGYPIYLKGSAANASEQPANARTASCCAKDCCVQAPLT